MTVTKVVSHIGSEGPSASSFGTLMATIHRSRRLGEAIARYKEIAPEVLAIIVALAEAAADEDARHEARV